MALVVGTNCGFVTSAPTGDPGAATHLATDGFARAALFTSPSGNNVVTEIGFFMFGTNTSLDTDLQMGIYGDAGAGEPEARLYVTSSTTGTTSGVWIRVSGLSWSISPSTQYWLAVQIDAHAGDASTVDRESNIHQGVSTLNAQTELPADWGTASGGDVNDVHGIYALYEAAGGTSTVTVTVLNDIQ